MPEGESIIRWGRVIVAAVLSEAGVIVALSAVLVAYRFVVAPGRPAAAYSAFNATASYYFAPFAAGIAVFLAAFWACRKLNSGFLLNGLLVGAFAVMLTAGFLFTAKPEERLMYVVSFGLRILGGLGGGVVAAGVAR